MSTMMDFVDIGTLITRSPEIKGGSPRIRGSGVMVHRVVGWYKLGLVPEEIVRKIGHVSLRDVYAALAYYHANSDEIESLLADEEHEFDRLAEETAKARHPA